LIDLETDERCILFWHSPGETPEYPSRVSIRSSEFSSLMLFSRPRDRDSSSYSVFRPEGRPEGEVRFDDSRKFTVEVTYSHERQRLRVPVAVRKGLDGRMTIDIAKGSGTF
jgi:hypothetical protein